MSEDPKFQEKLIAEFGDRGREWLLSLPDLLKDLAAAWRLTLAHAIRDLNVNYLCYCTAGDGAECVLKVGVPHRDLATEIEALMHYDGRGIVRALRADPGRHALLLERVRPARMLHDLRDNRRETRIGARVIKSLLRPAPEAHNLPN
ncbi:MAG: aminoglycoside phosphotransferase family protein, partial [Planctomycetota bacterium]|nr:aminoglycoside phosphotransferase family protein [Planctomycetota bacterium]